MILLSHCSIPRDTTVTLNIILLRMISILLTTAYLIHLPPGHGISHLLSSRTAFSGAGRWDFSLPLHFKLKHCSQMGTGPALRCRTRPPSTSHLLRKVRVRLKSSSSTKQSMALAIWAMGTPSDRAAFTEQLTCLQAEWGTSPDSLVRPFSHFQGKSS